MVKFKPYFERRYPRIAGIVAIIALINLGFVFFNLTYLNLRQVYRQHIPGLTRLYDPIKGIEAHPETEYYQARVAALEAQLSQPNVQPPQVEDSLLELRLLSQRLISETTFTGGNGENLLATVQQNVRLRTGETFASDAFNQFWSSAYLEQQGWQQELEFWNAQIRPFLQTNYYRRVNSAGVAVDYFWLIDLPFVLIFLADFTARMISTRRRHPNLIWADIILRRWYDLFLLLPFWRWLRIIPVTLRFYMVDWLDLEPVRAEVQRDIITTVGADLVGLAGIRIIEEIQNSIRQGDLLGWLSPDNSSPSHDSETPIVDEHEVGAIAHQLYHVSMHHVLPRIRPDLEELIQHSLATTLEQTPGYSQLNHVPGLGQISTQMVQQLSNSVVKNIYNSMAGTFLDSEGTEITARLQRNLRNAIVEEFSQHNTTQEIQSTLIDSLEDIKHNYVQAVAKAGGADLADRTEQLRRHIS